MPKRPTRPAADKKDSRQKKQETAKQPAALWKKFTAIVCSERFHFAVGLLLAFFVAYALLSYISYLFVGAKDFSVLGDDSLTRQELSQAILNKGGVLGARMQRFFIDRTFGLPIISALIFLLIYSLHMMRVPNICRWKVFLHCFFWLVWGSLAFAFIQHAVGTSSFFRWGGAHGEAICNFLLFNIDWIGTLLLLLGILTVYLVGVSHRTVPAFVAVGLWFKNLFQKLFSRLKRDHKNDDSQDVPDTIIDLNEGEEDCIAAETFQPENEGNIIDLTPSDSTPTKPEENKGQEPIFTISNDLAEDHLTPAEDSTQEQPASTLEIVPTAEEPMAEGQGESTLPEGETTEEIDLTQEGDPIAEGDLDIFSHTVETIDYNPETVLRQLGPFDPRAELSNYHFPSLDLLKTWPNENAPIINQDEQYQNANKIVTTLRNYGVEIESIKATVGPTVTLYEVVPKAGVKVAKIQNLEADIMMSLSAVGIRIIAPMPGKGTVGIEVPNEKPQVVSMHSVIASKRFQEEKKMRLPVAMGRTITNEVFMFDLAKTPHLLVAGATGQGKSVAINAIITSLLYKKHPAEMKMVLVDPKMVEFAPYKPLLRHYLAAQPDTDPNEVIITDCSRVIDTLNSLVIEMENRYKLLMDAGVRNLEDYNEKFVNRRLNPAKLVGDSLHHQYLPYIVIIIDEFGDFIMQAGKQVEQPIARITQKARAVGMHMILATQRPSTNIVTGVIKANIPTRIALRTQSVIDSRVILDAKGADQLIGRGDMLYAGNGDITRIQCAFVDTPEVDNIVEHIEKEQHYFAPYELPEYVGGEDGEAPAPGSVDLKKLDPMFGEVARYVVMNQSGSTSVLQRRFEIGYNRAGKLSDQLEAAGVVGPNKGAKGRDVLIQDLNALQEIFDRLGVS